FYGPGAARPAPTLAVTLDGFTKNAKGGGIVQIARQKSQAERSAPLSDRRDDITQAVKTPSKTAAKTSPARATCRLLSGSATTSLRGCGRPPGGTGASCST